MTREPTIPLREHYDALLAERDRRYTEVNAASTRAATVKERADDAALKLAREIQTYKDEKANDLRSQIESERGHYLTRDEHDIKHQALDDAISRISEQVAAMNAAQGATSSFRTTAIAVIGLLLTFLIVAVAISPHIH